MKTSKNQLAGNGNQKDPQVRDVNSGVSFEVLSKSERVFLKSVRAVFAHQNPKHILRELVCLGFEKVSGGRNGHSRLRHVKMTGSRIFPFGSSPSDRRYGLNFLRELRWAILARRCA